MFDSPQTKLQRMWTSKQYEQFLKTYEHDITTVDVSKMVAGKPDLEGSLAASGMHAGIPADVAINWNNLRRSATSGHTSAVDTARSQFSALNNTPARYIVQSSAQDSMRAAGSLELQVSLELQGSSERMDA